MKKFFLIIFLSVLLIPYGNLKAQDQPLLKLGDDFMALRPLTSEVKFFAFRLYSAHQWLKENKRSDWQDVSRTLGNLKDELLSDRSLSEYRKNIIRLLSGQELNMYVSAPRPRAMGASVEIYFSTMDPLQRAYAIMNKEQREKFRESLDDATKERLIDFEDEDSFKQVNEVYTKELIKPLDIEKVKIYIQQFLEQEPSRSDLKDIKNINRLIERFGESEILEKMNSGQIGNVQISNIGNTGNN